MEGLMRTLLAAFAIAPAILLGAGAVGPQRLDRIARQPLTRSTPQHYGNLPLVFEPNFGQVDGQVRFLTRSEGMTVFFTSDEAVMVLRRSTEEAAVVRMKLAGGRRSGEAVGLDKLPGISNYFIGNDPAKWRTDIPNYARIRYKSVYPGIDFVCYGKDRQLEYDLMVAPGADPNQIELAWEGVDRMRLNTRRRPGADDADRRCDSKTAAGGAGDRGAGGGSRFEVPDRGKAGEIRTGGL